MKIINNNNDVVLRARFSSRHEVIMSPTELSLLQAW